MNNQTEVGLLLWTKLKWFSVLLNESKFMTLFIGPKHARVRPGIYNIIMITNDSDAKCCL